MITIDQVEELATKLEADDAAQREKAARLIRAYCRILWLREPQRFQRRPTERRDEDGHWDNSYPPKQELRNFTGARLIKVRGWDYDDIATSSGFYYTWKRVTKDHGLYFDRFGRAYGADETGTGRLGQYAAHPGDCDVECEIAWSQRDELETAELIAAEQALRALAFPASTQRTEVES